MSELMRLVGSTGRASAGPRRPGLCPRRPLRLCSSLRNQNEPRAFVRLFQSSGIKSPLLPRFRVHWGFSRIKKKKKNDLRVVSVKFRTLEKSQTVALLFPGGFSGSAVTVDAPGQAQALPSPTPRCMSPAAWSPPLGGENVWLAAGAGPGEG